MEGLCVIFVTKDSPEGQRVSCLLEVTDEENSTKT